MNRKYTPAQLSFIKRRRRMPRRDLLAAFKRKFRRSGLTRPKLQDLCNRYGWDVGSKKGRHLGSRKYSKAELAFVRRRRKMARRELHAVFVKTFRRKDVTFENIKQLCTRNGWETDPRDRRRRTIGRTKYSKAERLWLKRRQTMPRREFWAAYVDKFGRDISLDAFKALGDRLGLRTGRTGCFKKGIVPANKGKKMPYNAGSARTQFKKGQRPRNTKHLGHERTDKDGYIWISVAETNPHTGYDRRYVFKHRLLWEKKHGPVPKGMVLKCKGDKSNSDPSNWEVISRAVLACRNRRFAGAKLPPEFEATAIAIAKLDQRIGERRKTA